ncbi:hypothetical protein MASR1M90_08500 [Desulfovibrionales bacterium]
MAYDLDILSLDYDECEDTSSPVCLAPVLCVQNEEAEPAITPVRLSISCILALLLHGICVAILSQTTTPMPLQAGIMELALVAAPQSGDQAPGPASPAPVVHDAAPEPPVVTQPEPTPVVPKKPVDIPKKTIKKSTPKMEQPRPAPAPPAQTPSVQPASPVATQETTPSPLPPSTHAGSGTGHGTRSAQGAGQGSGTGEHGLGPVQSAFGEANGPGFVRRVMPVFPRMARQRGREGVVILRLRISARGELIAVEVVQKAGYGFDEEALRAAQASIYSPATHNGRHVECTALLPIRFSLRNG